MPLLPWQSSTPPQQQPQQQGGYPKSGQLPPYAQQPMPMAVAKAMPVGTGSMPVAVAKAMPVAQASTQSMPTAKAMPTGQASQPPHPQQPQSASQPVHPRQPQPTDPKPASEDDGNIPPAPSGFSELNRLGVPELQYMQANELALDDWILDLPQVRSYVDKVQETREENAAVAKSILDMEKQLDEASALHKASCEELAAQRTVVEGLLQQRDEILNRQSAEAAGKILEEQAQESDDKAENLVMEALDQPGPLNGEALAQLRKSYVQHKVDKHWRLAAKERLETLSAKHGSQKAMQCF